MADEGWQMPYWCLDFDTMCALVKPAGVNTVVHIRDHTGKKGHL